MSFLCTLLYEAKQQDETPVYRNMTQLLWNGAQPLKKQNPLHLWNESNCTTQLWDGMQMRASRPKNTMCITRNKTTCSGSLWATFYRSHRWWPFAKRKLSTYPPTPVSLVAFKIFVHRPFPRQYFYLNDVLSVSLF